MEFEQVQGEFDNKYAVFKMATIFQHDRHMPCMSIYIYLYLCPK